MKLLGFFFIITSSLALLPTLDAFEDCFKVEGLLVSVFTPFTKNGTLATYIIRAYAQYLKDAGATGVLVGATYGEGLTLSLTENKRLLDAWKAATDDVDLIFVASVGGAPLPITQELAAYTEKLRVDAMMLLPEVFYKAKTVNELVFYIEQVYRAAPNTYLIYDDFPQYTGVFVDMRRFYLRCEEMIPTFRGVKTNVFKNVVELSPLVTGEQKLYSANYFYLAPSICLGIKNFVSAEFNLFPKLILDIIETGENGNMMQSTYYYQRLLYLIDSIVTRDNIIAAEKEALEIITGLEVGDVRPPLIPLSYDQKEAIRQKLECEDVIAR